MINSYNLIDGIDGNAAITGIISFICFEYYFGLLKNQPFFGLSLLLTGILIVYLPINLSKHKKGFMGDTGSMLNWLYTFLHLHLFLLMMKVCI